MKTCAKCKIAKPRANFYFCYSRKYPNLFRSECKSCTRLYRRKWQRKNVEKCRTYAIKSYFKHRVERINKILKYVKENPEKHTARSIVGRAIAEHKLIRPKVCPLCKKKKYKVEAHHKDYKKPRNITWMCRGCHMSHHNLVV